MATTMNPKARLFLIVAIGGITTLGSYIWGFSQYPELADDFWGGVPKEWIPLYTGNMLFAASGFLAALALLLKTSNDVQIHKLTLPYILILLPSTLWLPLTVWLLHEPSNWLWVVIRIDLILVGIGGLMLYPPIAGAPVNKVIRTLTLIIFSFFVFQTAVLDALVWTAYFHTV